jgi:hypothetical protein
MVKMLYGYVVLASCLLHLACSVRNDSIAGTVTDTGNPVTLSGVVTGEDGGPVAGVPVALYSRNYSPVNTYDDSQIMRQMQTAADGSYLFAKMSPGSYNILARDTMAGTAALIQDIAFTASDSAMEAPLIKLQKTGAIDVNLSQLSDLAGSYVYLAGTDVYAQVNASEFAAEMVSLASVPAAVYPGLNRARSTSAMGRALVAREIQVRPAQTTMLGPYAAWTSGYKLYINTTPAGANVAGDVFSFPLLVRLDASTTGDPSPFDHAQGDGGDLRFSKFDGLTPLSYEIERWDSANGTAEAWVGLDTVYGNNDSQFIYMYTGYGDAPVQSSGPSVFEPQYGFAGVWHMNQDLTDATGSGGDGTDFGTEDATGLMGSARSFDGGSYVRVEGLFGEPRMVTLSA